MTIRRWQAQVWAVGFFALLSVTPAHAGNPLLEYFSAYTNALKAVIGPVAASSASAGWASVEQFLETDSGLTVDDLGLSMDLGSTATNNTILTDFIGGQGQFDIAITAGYSKIGLANGLTAVATTITTVENVIDIIQLPFTIADAIQTSWSRMELTVSAIRDLEQNRRVNLWKLAQAVRANTNFDKQKFFSAMLSANPSLKGALGSFSEDLLGHTEIQDAYMKLYASAIAIAASRQAADRYGKINDGKDAVKLYIQDRIIASWKAQHPGQSVNPNLQIWAPKSGFWSFLLQGIELRQITADEAANFDEYDPSIDYPLAAPPTSNNVWQTTNTPNVPVNQVVPVGGTVTVAPFTNSLGQAVSSTSLPSDWQIVGNLNLSGGTLDLAGHTLTVAGNVIHTGGVLKINGGRLNVLGSYSLQTTTGANSTGTLNMTNPADWVQVNGGFLTQSTVDHTPFLTAGTLEIRGSFTQVFTASTGNANNFFTSGTLRVLLSGAAGQTVTFNSPSSTQSHFMTLQITNTSTAGITFNTPIALSELISTPANVLGPMSITGSTLPLTTLNNLSNVSLFGSTVTLTLDETFNGNLTLASGTLDLAGHTLTVAGNVIHTGGVLKINGGRLNVLGSYSLQTTTGANSTGTLNMTNPADWVQVNGGFLTQSTVDHAPFLTAGTLEIRGSFTQVFTASTGNANNFFTSGTHRVLLSGAAGQTVTFNSPSSTQSHFMTLQITNTSTAGITFNTPIALSELISTPANVLGPMSITGSTLPLTTLNNLSNVSLFGSTVTLTLDETFNGNLTLASGTLDLAGHTLTVAGNVIHTGGVLKINGGRLNVLGSYSLQTTTGANSTGTLNMTNPADWVQVNGGFLTQSTVDHTPFLTAGTLEIRGSFTQVFTASTGNANNFFTSGTLRVLLSGAAGQTVTFNSPSSTQSHFMTLQITNTSTAGITFNTPIALSELISTPANVLGPMSITGSTLPLTTLNNLSNVSLFGSTVTLTLDETFNGNLTLASGTLDLAGHTLTVAGNVIHTGGVLKINGGRLNVLGSYSLQTTTGANSTGTLNMTNPADWVQVNGGFLTQSTVDHTPFLTAGTLEIRGSFTQVFTASTGNANNFFTSGTHRVLLSGAAGQTVTFNSPSSTQSHFMTLQITNTSTAGITFNTPIALSELISTPANVLGPMSITGSTLPLTTLNNLSNVSLFGSTVTLTLDETFNGNLTLASGTLDLAGHTLTVAGNVIHTGGVLKINGGRLNVLGSYSLQTTTGANSTGTLNMTNPADWVQVNGGFLTQSTVDHTPFLTAGTLEIRGSFTQVFTASTGNANNFFTSGTLRVLLSGAAGQTVTFNSPSSTQSHFMTLQITNTSTAGITFNTPIALSELISTPANVLGPMSITGSTLPLTTLNNLSNVSLFGSTVTLTLDETFNGNLTLASGTLDLAGHTLTVAGNVIHTGGVLKINGGRLNVLGSYSLQTTTGANSTGTLNMTNPADWVQVNGGFLTQSTVDHAPFLTAGTLEIRGSFTQVFTASTGNANNFFTSGTHRVLLSGAAGQTIVFNSPSLTQSAFNILEWTGSASRLVFQTAYFVRVQSAQVIIFAPLQNKLTTDVPFVISASGGGSGNPVTFSSSTTAICTVATLASVTTVTLKAVAGTCSITANQLGGLGFTAALAVTQSFTVAPAAVTFTVTSSAGANGSITPLGAQNIVQGTTTTFSVVPNAGFGSAVSSTCGGSLTGTTFTTLAITTNCTVSATFSAILSAPGAPTISSATGGNGQAIVSFSPPASNGGAAITSYTTTCNPGGFTVTTGTSPATVGGLTNGTTYSCSVAAINSVGTGPFSASVSVTPQVALAFLGAFSRKTHGAIGDFDLPISLAGGLTGAVTVDSRQLGAGHKIVFKFNQAVTAPGTITVVDAALNTVGNTAVANGNELIVTVPTLQNGKRIRVTVSGLNGSFGQSVVVGYLMGDVNASLIVDANDIRALKARAGQRTDPSNYLFDLNASGVINGSDVSAVKARIGTTLP